MMTHMMLVIRRVLVLMMLGMVWHVANAMQPELVSEKEARWEFKTATNKQGITNIWSEVPIDGSALGLFYGSRGVMLRFQYKEREWLERVGEITIDGQMLNAYRYCYQEESPYCKTQSNYFELLLDRESLAQMKKGSELRTTIKFQNGVLRTFTVSLKGTSAAFNQLQQTWKQAGVNDLILAVMLRDDKLIKSLLASGQDANVRDKAGRSPLSIVLPGKYYDDEVTDKDKALIRLLTQYGGNINQLRREPILVEHLSGGASLSFIHFLLQSGANPNFKGPQGEPAILAISNREDFQKAYRLLVKEGADKYATDKMGMNLLHKLAVAPHWSGSNKEKIEFLLDDGYKINLKDKGGRTALIYAAIWGSRENAKLLVQKGAHTNPTFKGGEKAQDALKKSIDEAKSAGDSELTSKLERGLEFLKDARVFKIAFKNETSEKVHVAVRYKTRDGDWVTKEWFSFAPDEEGFVAKTENGIFYYYAISDDGDWEWGGSDRYYYVQGMDDKQGFKKKSAETKHRSGTYTITLTD